jgi:Carboxypeptidase regulatory-like domain
MARRTWILIVAAGAVAVWFALREGAAAGAGGSATEPGERSVSGDAARPRPASRAEPRSDPLPESAPAVVAGAEQQLLAGRVLDRGRIPVTHGHVRVVLRTPHDQPVYATASSFDQRVALDRDGRFRVAVPRNGKYLVIADPGDVAMAFRDWVDPHEELELVADVAATLRGRIVRRETNQPVAGAWVSVRLPGVHDLVVRQTLTRDGGEYEFSGLPEGALAIVTTFDGLMGNWFDLSLEAGGVKVHDVCLDQGLTVSGRVLEAGTGRPIGGARVGGPQRSVVSDASGAFSMSGLEPRDYAFAAWASGWVPEERTLTVSRHRNPTEVVFALEKGEVVRGSVVDLHDRPIEGVRIQTRAGEAFSDAQGRFEVVRKAGGDAVFTITRAGYSPQMLLSSHAAFANGEPIRLQPADVVIAGRVKDSAGRPFGGARIICRATATGGEGFERVLGSGQDGAFEIDGCPRWSAFDVIALAPGLSEAAVQVLQQFDQARVEVELVLEETPSVEGTVVDAGGAPIAGARVVLTAYGAMHAIGTSARASTDQQGRYSIPSPFGRDMTHLRVTASAPGWAPGEVLAEQGRFDRVDPIVLVATGRIRGRLVSSSTGEAVKRAQLSLARFQVPPDLASGRVDGYFGRTADEAEFEFEAPAGRYWVIPEVEGFVPIPHVVEVKPGAATDMGRVSLPVATSLEGRISGLSPGMIAAIYLRATNGRPFQTAQTDATGWYRADRILPGTYDAFAVELNPRAWCASPSPSIAPPWPIGTVRLAAGAPPARLDGSLLDRAKLTVTLSGDIDPPGDGVSHGWILNSSVSGLPPPVSISAIDGTPLSVDGSGFTSNIGAFSFWLGDGFTLDLPPSRCRVTFSAPGYEHDDATVQLSVDREARVDLVLKRVAPESRPR